MMMMIVREKRNTYDLVSDPIATRAASSPDYQAILVDPVAYVEWVCEGDLGALDLGRHCG